MNTFSYNINEDTICCSVYGGGTIKDITISSSHDKTEKDLVPEATKSISRLVEQHPASSIRFRYPPISKGSKQRNMIEEMCSLDGTEVDFKKSPYSINSSIATMYRGNEVNYVSFNNTDDPLYLYTDASVVESRNPSISSCILNGDREILLLLCCSIRSVRNVATAELIAGYLGLQMCEQYQTEHVEWFCDNNTVIRFINGEQESKIEGNYFSRNIRGLFDSIDKSNTNEIRGSDNKLADSMVKDIRHEEVHGIIQFISPAVQKRTDIANTVGEIRENL